MEIFKSEAITVRPSTLTYRGAGYRYHFHRDNGKGSFAKLQICGDLLKRFADRVGHVNSVRIPGLEFCYQGGGWYSVFSVRDKMDGLVSKFLKRLNTWALKQVTVGPELPPSHKTRYTVQAPMINRPVHFERRPRFVPPMYVSPVLAPTAKEKMEEQLGHMMNIGVQKERLTALVQKFGHQHQRRLS